jgi:DNA (cytosine-5)-methyltransferase 1
MQNLLDLFCGQGGAAMGYHRAGFDVIGADHEWQYLFPFRLYRQDWREALAEHAAWADVIHASPPCQKYSAMARRWPEKRYVDLVGEVRAALKETGKPYIIENVPDAPLRRDVMLCGVMFGLKVYRHRVFELSDGLLVLSPPHTKHPIKMARSANSRTRIEANGGYVTACGHLDAGLAGAAMGIDWMDARGLSQAIPPAYTELIGRQLLGKTGNF